MKINKKIIYLIILILMIIPINIVYAGENEKIYEGSNKQEKKAMSHMHKKLPLI